MSINFYAVDVTLTNHIIKWTDKKLKELHKISRKLLTMNDDSYPNSGVVRRGQVI